MTVESTVQDLIDSQMANATDLLEQASDAAEQALLAAITSTTLPSVSNIPLPDVDLPFANPFLVDQAGEFATAYANAVADYAPDFASQFNAFIANYFPDIAGCIRDNSDDWICNMIVNGGNGIPPAVEAQIWDRARSREVELAMENTDLAVNEWAGRGFSLPTGALANRVQKVNQDAIDKAATVSRDIAIKNIEIQIENIRFAVTKAVELRLGAVRAATDYIKAWFLVPQTGIDYAKALTDARYRYYNAMQAYYGAVVAGAGLTVEVQKANQSKAVQENKTFADLVASLTASRASAATAVATSLARAAAAAVGATNSLANYGYVGQEQI
jgi:hypothetical protein